MALHWRPVGPEPASVYWQRRAVALLVVAALLLLVRALVVDGGGPDRLASAPAPVPSASSAGTASAGTASAAPVPGPSPTEPAVRGCDPAVITVEALADRDDYPADGTPRLTLRVANTGAAPCRQDLGAANVELVVTSGSDRIWSSDDCSPGGEPRRVVLVPDQPDEQSVTWDGTRSQPGCPGSDVRAQPGTYRVAARVGRQVVEGDVFRIG